MGHRRHYDVAHGHCLLNNKATGTHNMQSVAVGIVNISGGDSMDYSE